MQHLIAYTDHIIKELKTALSIEGQGLGIMHTEKGVMLYKKHSQDFQYVGVRDKFVREYFYIRMLENSTNQTYIKCALHEEKARLRLVRVSLNREDWQLAAPIKTALALINFDAITDGRKYFPPVRKQHISIDNETSNTKAVFDAEVPNAKAKLNNSIGLCAIDFTLSYVVDYAKFKLVKVPIVIESDAQQPYLSDDFGNGLADDFGNMLL